MHALLLASGSGDSGGSSIFPLLILLVPVLMYVLLIRPQRKRMKAQQSVQAEIGIGDEVVTNAGIYGFITGVEGDKFWLEIDDDVQIRIARAAIQGRANSSSDDDDDSTDKPEKADKRGKAGKADAADKADTPVEQSVDEVVDDASDDAS